MKTLWRAIVCLVPLLLTASAAVARPGGDGAAPVATGSYPEVLVGGPPMEFAAAKQNTLYVYGGPGTVEGKFEDANGMPNWQGWTHEDLTSQTQYWNIDQYNCQNLDPPTVPNHAWWCGRTYSHECGTGDYAGYGPDWLQGLEWTGTVPDPGQPITVTVNARLNHDLELNYDFLYLGYKGDSDFVIEQSFTGQGVDVVVGATFVADPTYFTGPQHDQVRLRWEFRSDGAWDDEDCLYPSVGAAQIDLIQVLFDGFPQGAVEDCEVPGSAQWQFAPVGVGDFAKLWSGLSDLDDCTDNPTPQVAFIDDGLVVPGTGGSNCINWCYGPGGFTVNITGGLIGSQYYLNNQVLSPVLAWPVGGFNAGMLEFDLWSHPLVGAENPQIHYTWRVRSTDSGNPGDLEAVLWQTGAFYGGLSDYGRYRVDLSNVLVPGCTHFQVALGVWQYGAGGTDAAPAPYYDNVCVKAYDRLGPAVSASEVRLAQDNFPASGWLDPGNPGSNAVRFDRAQNTAPPPANVPGDELQATVTPRTGAVLTGPPRLYYRIRPNPLFDPYRMPAIPFPDGYVEGTQLFPGGTTWLFDLQDEDFLFPGDVVHYFFRAEEDLAGNVALTMLPADTTGFSDFSAVSLYDSPFTMRALPSVTDDGMGGFDQPDILLWNDYGSLGGEDEWRTTLDNLGFQPGMDYDIYTTKSPNSGTGNGLGGRATVLQIQGYQTMLYSSGDAESFTITDNVVSGDAGDDIGLLNSWLSLGYKNLLLTGNHLACDLAANYGAAGTAFLGWPSIWLLSCDIRPFVGNQSAPAAMPVPGNPVVGQPDCWIAFGGCPDPQTFDRVAVAGGAVALASFTGPGCTPGTYPGTVAGSLAANLSGSNEAVIYLPYDLMQVYDPMKAPLPSVERTRLLEEILLYFGSFSSFPVRLPDLSLSTAVTAAGQPVSCYVMPDGTGDPLSDVTVFGGGRIDATITLTLVDGGGVPVADYPAEDLWLGTTLGGLALCEGGAVADANTGPDGVTTFSGPLRGGGHSDLPGGETLQVVVAGTPLPQPGFQVGFHSADINGDLTVGSADLSAWAADWFSGSGYRSDFYWDGALDLADAILWVEGGGAACR